MTARRSCVPLAILLIWAWTDRAEAQSAPTSARGGQCLTSALTYCSTRRAES